MMMIFSGADDADEHGFDLIAIKTVYIRVFRA